MWLAKRYRSKKGSIIDPGGTPLAIFLISDDTPSTITARVLSNGSNLLIVLYF